MSIVREPEHTANFTVLDNGHANDERLTLTATAVLDYLLRKPADWEPNTRDLMRRFACGRHRILEAMKVLEAAGYVQRRHYQDDKGRRRHSTTVREIALPVTPPAQPETAPQPHSPLFDDSEVQSWSDERTDFLTYKRQQKSKVQKPDCGEKTGKPRPPRPSLGGRKANPDDTQIPRRRKTRVR